MTHSIEIIATLFFGLAIGHTFLVSSFRRLAHRFPQGSIAENLFHLLGEVEVVFGLWASLLFVVILSMQGSHAAVAYMESLDFTEPFFVFVIMAMAATRPVVEAASLLVKKLAAVLPFQRPIGNYFVCLTIGPLLGSFITEPAAMTVTALILKDAFFGPHHSQRFKYITLALLFVNVSIGGALTPYAAPPILMVAGKWGWDLPFMMSHFGWKVILAILLNTTLGILLCRQDILKSEGESEPKSTHNAPLWLKGLHLLCVAGVVMTAHHPKVFMGIFLSFLGIVTVTREFQGRLQLRESLLVAYFLGGLVFFGRLQRWWLEPLISGLEPFPLFLGATALTSITDNAALTYLGSQVENTSELFKYALVEGAIAGGGLTVIANAPNPAGYSILQERFGSRGIEAGKLFLAALVPTLIAMCCLWLL